MNNSFLFSSPSIRPGERWKSAVQRFGSKQHLTLSERILLYDRLALFLRSGIPLIQGLGFVHDTAHRRSSRAVLRAVRTEVAHGMSLASSMRIAAAGFPTFESRIVELGEHGGTLPDSLGHLSVLLQRRRELTRTLVSALTYPALIAIGTMLVTGFLILFAFPKIIPIFKGLHVPLPITTRILIAVSEFIADSWPVLIAIAVMFAFAAFGMRRIPAVRSWHAGFFIALPLLGPLMRSYHTALTMRTLALLLASGVPLMTGLSLTSHATRHPHYRDALQTAASLVRDGHRLSDGLQKFPHIFSPAVAQLIAAGEMTGTLPVSVRMAADLFERSLDEQARTLTSLIEPLLMVAMGSIVGFVAIAIIAPMYGITQNLSPH